jgi:hypothetical protein
MSILSLQSSIDVQAAVRAFDVAYTAHGAELIARDKRGGSDGFEIHATHYVLRLGQLVDVLHYVESSRGRTFESKPQELIEHTFLERPIPSSGIVVATTRRRTRSLDQSPLPVSIIDLARSPVVRCEAYRWLTSTSRYVKLAKNDPYCSTFR